MRRKSVAAVLAAVIMCMGLTGCGENVIPEMTDEQIKDVGEFVAITMMKYDASHRSRLVDLDKLDSKPASSVTPEPEATKKPSGMGSVDDTPVIDSTGTENRDTLEEAMSLPEGMRVVYSGYEVCDKYPNDEEMALFPLAAARGTKLLVLKFMLAETSGQDQQLDLLYSGAVFKVTINKSDTKRALFTSLLNDMPTYQGTVKGNSSEEVVVVVQVDEETASNINSISLNVKGNEKNCTMELL